MTVTERLTIGQIDEALLATVEAFRRAMTRGSLDEADAYYRRLDELLDMRLAIPHPRSDTLH